MTIDMQVYMVFTAVRPPNDALKAPRVTPNQPTVLDLGHFCASGHADMYGFYRSGGVNHCEGFSKCEGGLRRNSRLRKNEKVDTQICMVFTGPEPRAKIKDFKNLQRLQTK